MSWRSPLWDLGTSSRLVFLSTERKQYTVSSWWRKFLRLHPNFFGKDWKKTCSVWCTGKDSPRADPGFLSLDRPFTFYQRPVPVSWDFRQDNQARAKGKLHHLLACLSVKLRSRSQTLHFWTFSAKTQLLCLLLVLVEALGTLRLPQWVWPPGGVPRSQHTIENNPAAHGIAKGRARVWFPHYKRWTHWHFFLGWNLDSWNPNVIRLPGSPQSSLTKCSNGPDVPSNTLVTQCTSSCLLSREFPTHSQ